MKTNIEIPVADLKTVLPGLSKIVSKRSSLPVLGCVKLTLNLDRTLHIQANNLDQIVTARLNKPFHGKPGAMLVPLDELSSMTKRCAADDTIELSVDGKETSITCTAAGTRIKKPLAHLGVEDFPSDTEVNTEPVKLDEAFKEALHQAFDCAGVDSARYVIQGACLDVSNKEAHYVVGTNGHHLYSANSFLFDVPDCINLPPGKFLTWDGFVDDGPWTLRYQPGTKAETKAKISEKPAWVRLDSDHWTYVSKPIPGPYPSWKQIVPPADVLKSHVTLEEAGIKMILDALPLLPGAEEFNQGVSLEIKGEYLTLKAKGKGDWTEIPIPAKVSGLPVRVTLNRTYLAKALKFGLSQLDIEDNLSPMVFSAKGKIMVVSQLRPPDTKQVPAAPTTPTTPPTSAAATPAAASTATTPSTQQPQQPATQPTPEPATQERKDMPRTARTTTPETAARPSLTSEVQDNHNSNGTNSAVKSLVDQVESIKDGLRGIIRDLSGVADTVKQAEKEKKVTDKEIEAVRAKLRQIQNVTI